MIDIKGKIGYNKDSQTHDRKQKRGAFFYAKICKLNTTSVQRSACLCWGGICALGCAFGDDNPAEQALFCLPTK